MDFCWQRAKHSAVRELGWSLFSPPIQHYTLSASDNQWQVDWDEEAVWLFRELEQSPARLNTYLAGLNDRRLGARFEALWHFFLNNHSAYEVRASNLQITLDGQTLGALDFLIEDYRTGQIVHLELAVKFYLLSIGAQASQLSSWIGPNPDDNLELKVRHMREHQLTLSDHDRTRAFLKRKGLPQADIRCAHMAGCLFGHKQPVGLDAPQIYPCHQRGAWGHGQDLAGLKASFPGYHWYHVDKTQWLDPYPETRGAVTSNGEQTGMYWGVSDTGEKMRIFVAEKSWPRKATY